MNRQVAGPTSIEWKGQQKMSQGTKWNVVVEATKTETEEYVAYGRPNMADVWTMFLVRSDDGSNFITAAFPTSRIISIMADGVG